MAVKAQGMKVVVTHSQVCYKLLGGAMNGWGVPVVWPVMPGLQTFHGSRAAACMHPAMNACLRVTPRAPRLSGFAQD